MTWQICAVLMGALCMLCVGVPQERRLKRLGLMDEDGSTTYDSFFRDGIA
jgi:hypothetical protein